MNQSILFPDIQQWDPKNREITFPAQHEGALIECRVAIGYLSNLLGKQVELMVPEPEALALFSQCRFDIEELVENLIEDESFNSLGQIEIR